MPVQGEGNVKIRERVRRGLSLLLVLTLAALMGSMTIPAAASDGSVELVAAFDKSSYDAGDAVSVSFTVYGSDLDVAGVHITYDPDSLQYHGTKPGDGFTMPVCRENSGSFELTVQSGTVRQPGGSGMVIATATFTAVDSGAKTLAFSAGSAAYLEGKSAVAYNGYQTLHVTTAVISDAAADTALRQAKASAAAALDADINAWLEAGVTVAQRELLLRCQKNGQAAISGAASQAAVEAALKDALEEAGEIANDTALELPRLTALYDAEKNDSPTVGDIYPTFSPDTTAYFLYTNRPINGTPRRFKGATGENVAVTFNGEAVAVTEDGTFAFAVPFQALENCSTLVLTDENTGLSTTYVFYSFAYGVRSAFSNIKIYDEDGEDPGNKIQSVALSEATTRFSTNIDRVCIGFDGAAAANQECVVELVDGDENVLQRFVFASGDEAVSQSFLSDVIQLKKGLNCLLLRTRGVDNSSFVDGKPVSIPAYSTRALVIYYVAPEDEDPTLVDASLDEDAVQLYTASAVGQAEARTISFERTDDGSTAEARYESTLALSPEDFDLGENLQYLRQTINLCITPKDGQEISVSGGNDTPQPRTLLADGSCHVADYYETFGSAGKPTVMKADDFTVSITVTAKDGIHKAVYVLTVNKSGRAAMTIPQSYQSRELTITDRNPIRTMQLTFNGVSITDTDGKGINTARALDAGTLKIELADPAVASWDGETRNGDSITVALHTQGKTDIRLIYDDGTLHLEGEAVLYVNYEIGMLAVARSDAADLWTEAQNGEREYEDGAADELQTAILAANEVYGKYASVRRYYLTQTNFDEINNAVNTLNAAIREFKYKELGVKIVAFDPLPEDLPLEVAHELQPEDFTPKTMGVTTAAGEHLTLDVTWKCSPDYADHDGQPSDLKYSFTLVLPAGYVPVEGLELPSFIVTRIGKPFENPLTPDNVWLPEAVDGGRAVKAVKSVGTPVALRVYQGTTLDEILALTLETGAGPQQAALPTKWLTVPEDYDPDNVGGSYLFTLTAVAEQLDGNRIWHWHDDFTEDRREFQLRVYIIPAPVVRVAGLPDTQESVTLTGEKVDSVLGATARSAVTLKVTAADGWEKELLGAAWRGAQLCKPSYSFTPPAIEGYTATVETAADGYTVRYKPDALQDIEWLTADPLVLTDNGRKAELRTSDQPGAAVITWGTADSSVASVADTSATAAKLTPHKTGDTTVTVTVTHGGQEKSSECRVIVLPTELSLEILTLKPDAEGTLSFPYLDELWERITWSSDDESIVTVKDGVVTAHQKGTATVTATVRTDNADGSAAVVSCAVVVIPNSDGGNGGGDGSGNGGGGRLNGQTTSGGSGYSDRLADGGQTQSGGAAAASRTTGTAQEERQTQTNTVQTSEQQPEAAAETAGSANSGGAAAGGGTGRVYAVSKGEADGAVLSEAGLAVILLVCSVLLLLGLLRGRLRGRD